MLSKEQKILLFETIIKQYCEESSMKLLQRRFYWKERNLAGPGICTRISNVSRSLFGEATFAHEIIEFRASCRKFNKEKRLALMWEIEDIDSRIEFLDNCIRIC